MSKSRDLGEFPAAALDIDASGNVSVTGDLSLPDNGKAAFGASDDLQIYHDGSNSYISELGTGDLVLQSNGAKIGLASSSPFEWMVEAVTDGEVKLHHNGSSKLSTTATGIDVAGTVTADGLTVDGGASVVGSLGTFAVNSEGAVVSFSRPSTTYLRASDVSGSLRLDTGGSIGRLYVANNGDISFYEDTGTTPKFFWDASAESLGIGTSSPTTYGVSGADKLVIGEADGNNGLTISSFNNSNGTIAFADTTNATVGRGYLEYSHSDNSMVIGTNGTERMRIDSSGNVGIGTTAPFGKLSVSVSAGAPSASGNMANGLTIHNGDGGRAIQLGINETGAYSYLQSAYVNNANTATPLAFFTGATERLRIDSAGNVGIGVVPKTGGSTWQHVQFGGTGNLIARKADSTVDSMFANNYYVNSSGVDSYITTGAAARMFFNDENISFDQAASGATDAAISWSEAMRIDSSGNLLVGTTGVLGASLSTGKVQVLNTNAAGHGASFQTNATSGYAAGAFARNSNTGPVCEFFHNPSASAVGKIIVDSTSTVYATSSDYRLKEDDLPMTGATERVKALRPVNFAWKADGTRVDGFFAHEVQEVVPEAATGAKDAMMDEEYEVTPAVYENVTTPAVEAVLDEDGVVITDAVEESTESVLVTEAVMGTRSVPDYQGIDQSKLVPLLTATIQELIARIEILEAK